MNNLAVLGEGGGDEAVAGKKNRSTTGEEEGNEK